jgi:hypothetical protein
MVYQTECQDFRHLQLGNKNRYEDVGTYSVIVKLKEFYWHELRSHPDCS